MANLAGPPMARIDFGALEIILATLCERMGVDAAWAGYRDDDGVVIAAATAAAADFDSAAGSRVAWDEAMEAGPRDARGRQLTQRWHGDTDVVDGAQVLSGSHLFEVARIRAGAVPVGFVSFASKTLVPKPADAHLREAAAAAQLFAQLVAPVLDADLQRREIRDRVVDEIDQDRLVTVFQPVAETRTGRVVGAEALSRFSCPPERPDLWFAEAASVGLGPELELAAIRKALDGLPSLPPDTYLAVNLSPEVFLRPELRDAVAASFPDRIVLELTEHDAIDDYAPVIDKARQYRDLGCRLAVDDVGAGFASFAHVLNIKPDLVKIDLTLTRGIDGDLARCTLVRAIVDVAARIDATVIAEGVETRDELDVLATLGVTHAQGYLLAKPGPLPLPVGTVHARPSADRPRPLLNADGDTTAADRFELALRHSPIGMAVMGRDGRVLHANRAMAAMLGYSEAELVGMTYEEMTHPEDLGQDAALALECLNGVRDSYRIDKRYITKTGSVVWGDLSVAVVRSDDNEPLYAVSQIQDITERRHREQRLARRAATDSLTGIANREAATERIQYLLDHARQFGVLFCDIDEFKSINDRYGHDGGDQVLISVAQRIRAALRDSDTVARWGGDEFIAIVADADQRTLQRKAQRIHDNVVRTITLQPDQEMLTPSITTGTTHHAAGDVATPTELVRRADHAMYHRRNTTRPS